MPDVLEIGEVPDDESLVRLTAREALGYFRKESNEPDGVPDTHCGGLVRDSARPGSPCSIAAAGFAAVAYASGEALGLLSRDEARRLTLEIVCTFRDANLTPRHAGSRGFFYHFLEADGPRRGRRAWRSELSTIDTALLVAGLLVAASHFDHESAEEEEIRRGANAIYERIDWPFMVRRSGRICHGWRPGKVGRGDRNHTADGFLKYDWVGYNEGLLLYLLALGSPTHPVPAESYEAWCAGYEVSWQTVYGIEYLHAPPLFVHQFPQAFVDFRDLRDGFGRDRGLDYFENTRRATLVQIEYAKDNPHRFDGYSATTWGISASNGPGILHRKQLHRDGRMLRFLRYNERGVPPPEGVPDDGTLAPWATAASLPFLPHEVLRAVEAHREVALCHSGWTGFMASYNLNYRAEECPHGWVDEHDLAIEQAPIVMMAANYLHDSIWQASRRCEPIQRGLRRAGFRGGWLNG